MPASAVQPDGAYTLQAQLTGGSASVTGSKVSTLDNTLPTGSLLYPAANEVISNVYLSGSYNYDIWGSADDANFDYWQLLRGNGTAPSTWSGVGSSYYRSPSTTRLKTWSSQGLSGVYTMRLNVADMAGNSIQIDRPFIVGHFSASQTGLELNNTTGGTVAYTSVVPFALTESIQIKNAAGQTVRTMTFNRTIEGTYVDTWDGRNDQNTLVPEGAYFYIAVASAGGKSMTWDESDSVLFDDFVQRGTPVFLGNLDPFNNRPFTFTYNVSEPGLLSIGFSPNYSDAGIPGGCDPPNFCLAESQYISSGTHTFTWAGIDNTGAFRSDIRGYAVVVLRRLFAKNAVVVFGAKPSVSNLTVNPPYYSPDNGSQSVSFDLSTYQSQAAEVTLEFQNHESLSTLRTIQLGNVAAGAFTLQWDGRADNGMPVAPGGYTVTVTATDSIGNQAKTQILTTIQY